MARYLDLYMDQNSSFMVKLPPVKDADGSVINLTNYTLVAKMSRSHFTRIARNRILIGAASTGNDAVAGIITLSLPSPASLISPSTISNTQTTAVRPARYVWDCMINGPLGVIRAFEGILTVNPDVFVEIA